MYKVLIADDNALIRKSIKKRVPWKELQMTCIGEAENGKETAEIIKELLPDIVITDIKMPVADGFYAIEMTKDVFPNIQFIIISGYDDFAYLKQSIQFQVLNYILKPIDTDELVESLKKAAIQFTRQQSAKAYKTRYDRKQLNDIFYRYLSGCYDFHTFAERLTECQYPVFQETCQCLCLNWAVDSHCRDLLDDCQREELEKKLEDICNPASCRVFCMYHNTYLVLLTHSVHTVISLPMLQRIRNHCCHLTEALAPLYLSASEPFQFQNLSVAYSHVLKQLLYRFCEPKQKSMIFLGREPKLLALDSSPDQELSLAFELQLYDECKRIIGQLLTKASGSWDLFCTTVPHLISLLDVRLSLIMGQDLFTRQKRELYLLLYSDTARLQESLFQIIDQLPRSTKENVGEQAIRYIKGNYRSPLTLHRLSELFFVNQIYLGQLIRKQTQKSFNNFLNELRMEEAYQLILKEPGISLTSLALSLGYTDAHYFTKVFKRFYGITPSELKKEQ